jgi:hypothetical protein
MLSILRVFPAARRWRPNCKIQEPPGARFLGTVEIFATRAQKRLTYKIIAPTMQLSTCTYVLVDKK